MLPDFHEKPEIQGLMGNFSKEMRRRLAWSEDSAGKGWGSPVLGGGER